MKGGVFLIRKLTNVGLWVLLVLGAIGGVGRLVDIVQPTSSESITNVVEQRGDETLALNFAKVWLTVSKGEKLEQRQKAIETYLPTTKITDWVPPEVGQTARDIYVREVNRLSSNFAVFTVEVWSELSTGAKRQVLLNVPIFRTAEGTYAVAGEPVLLPPPPLGEKPPSTGQEATKEVYDLATPFLTDFARTYFSATDRNQLANMLIPGVVIEPMKGFMEFKKVSQIKIVVLAEKRYEAIMTVIVKDPTTKMLLPEQFLVDFTQDENGRLGVEKIWRH